MRFCVKSNGIGGPNGRSFRPSCKNHAVLGEILDRGLANMMQNTKLAALRNMLLQMEAEIGLEKLSQPQKDVYYAACLVADEDQVIHSESVKHHPMLTPMARPTFYRALKELVQKGFLAAVSSQKNGKYRINR